MTAMRLLRTTGLAVIVTVGAWSAAMADDLATGAEEKGDASIAACTRVIASGEIRGAALARVLTSRGQVYSGKRETDRAISDFNEAIRLEPRYAPAFFGRGVVHAIRRE